MDSHILTRVDVSLEGLRGQVLMMGQLAERELCSSMAWLQRGDRSGCAIAINDDAQLDALHKRIDHDAFKLQILFHPVASDLRRVRAAIRVSEIIERVGGEAVQIAERARQLSDNPPLDEVPMFRPSWPQPIKRFADSIRVYGNYDNRLARLTLAHRRSFDAIAHTLDQQLVAAIGKAPQHRADYVNLLCIARHLKRVSDCATEIVEAAIFLHKAEDVRHPNNPFDNLEDVELHPSA